jgi:hypothetical protein
LPVLVAFASGVLLLQWQATLPPPSVYATAFALTATGVLAMLCSVGGSARSRIIASPVVAASAAALATALVILAAAAVGFAYAALRAEARLADALPVAWEGEDIALVGVVDDLPQASARGTRFAFARTHADPRCDRARACRSPGMQTTKNTGDECRRPSRPASAGGRRPLEAAAQPLSTARLTSKRGCSRTTCARRATFAPTGATGALMPSPDARTT